MNICTLTQSTDAFPALTKETAPTASRDALTRLEQSVGGIPNLAAAMAHSPALIDGFVTLREIVQKNANFTPVEREIIFLVNATANACGYCQAIHSTFGLKTGLSQSDVDAIRAGQLLRDAKQNALVSFSRSIAFNKGNVTAEQIDAFLAAGYNKTHILDLVACFAQSVMANYAGHITHAKPDEFIQPQYKEAA